VAGPFFVVGTGCCGTGILRKVIGEHPDVYALHWEGRFLTDPGGFEDLVRVLNTDYRPFQAHDAINRLAIMLNQTLVGYGPDTYRGWGLAKEIGYDHYRMAVDRLWDRITWYEFDEEVTPLSAEFGRWEWAPDEKKVCRRVVGRYFTERAELIAILREFIEEVFGGAADRAGKKTWCEKTPFNLLAVPFLWELFPEATVVAIMRRPLAVLAAHLDQAWAPSTTDAALNWLEPLYQSWLRQRPSLLADRRYVEVKAEELADDWERGRSQLFGRMGLPDAYTPSRFLSSRLRSRDSQLDSKQMEHARKRLAWITRALGYETEDRAAHECPGLT
jgi:hypothetical protein